MDRRDFFRKAAGKAAKVVVEEARENVAQRAAHWIRPPYALEELEFLLACTRCKACIEACSYGVIFPLASRLGAQVVGTPALDLLNKACHLCGDWPCVKVCEPGALSLPPVDEQGQLALPRLARAWVNESACLPYRGPECGACAGSCPVPGALLWEWERPRIDQEKCTGCGLCREQCILEPKAIAIRSLYREENT